MLVTPPAAAAPAPLAMVSICSSPGSRSCTRMSTSPGARHFVASAVMWSLIEDKRCAPSPVMDDASNVPLPSSSWSAVPSAMICTAVMPEVFAMASAICVTPSLEASRKTMVALGSTPASRLW